MSKQVVLCYAEDCDGKVYKNGYCVEHYVAFGDAPHPPKAGSENAAAAASATRTSGDDNKASASSGSNSNSSSSAAATGSASPTFNVKSLGGGGVPCTICDKICYPAEITKFEDKLYHRECFKCTQCIKKLAMGDAAVFENKLYCKKCWEKNGFTRKQTKVQWTKKEGSKPTANRLGLGGGGIPCTSCNKTVYPGEAVQYDAKTYHGKCFRCSACEKICVPSEVNKFEGKLFCKRDWELGKFSQKQAQTVQNFVPKGTEK